MMKQFNDWVIPSLFELTMLHKIQYMFASIHFISKYLLITMIRRAD